MKNKIKKYAFVFVFVFIMTFFSFKLNVSANIIDNIVPIKVENCDTLLGDPTIPSHPAYWIQKGLDIIKYVAILSLLGLSIADFAKAIISNDKDAVKKAGVKSLKRFVYCTIIFFLPILINFVLEIFELTGTCGYQ